MNDYSYDDDRDDETSDSQSAPNTNPNGLHAFETLGRWLESDGWFPVQDEERYMFRVNFSGKNGLLRCYASVKVDLQQYVFYAISPIKVPEELRMAVAEFITRANYGLRIGNFELDYNDGEVRYKSSLDFEDTELNDELIRHATYAAVQTMDHYLPGLMRVIYGGATPYEAIREIEG